MMKALKRQIAPHWQGLQKREQRLVLGAASLVGVALVWWIALAPALQTLRQFKTSEQALNQQMDHMLALRQQAQALQAQNKAVSLTPASAQRNVQTATTALLGTTGQLQVVGERVTVRLQNTPAASLAQWLQQTRETAHAMPVQAELTRSGPAAAPLWSGPVTLALPTP